MLIVHVFFNIKTNKSDAFKDASMENALNSRKEPGVVSFDVFQQQDDPSKFLFIEIYQSADDQIKHRETAHFKRWRESIEEMLIEPYTFLKYNKLYDE